ncbi:hypothetical protein N0V90_005607 [Kalmusia sp. IMI 367209]|nr:hypothetical protein N0V90_005607 [Kalmusia sp. IMI 367209]
MASLLKSLREYVSEEDSAHIGDLLEAVDEELSETRPAPATLINNTDDGDWKGTTTMPQCLENVNIESLDFIDEDLHQSNISQATGFVGQSSEVQWLRSFLLLERGDDDSTSEQQGSSARPASHEQVSAVTFYLDNENIDPEYEANPYELPASYVAEQLLHNYMEKVQDSFPILPRDSFEDQFRKTFEKVRHGKTPQLNVKWQATLNLVFAIGSKYSHLVKTSWQTDEQDHLTYQARACTLAWNEPTLTQHPDIPQIQVAGLLAFYFLSTGQASR